MKGGFLYYVLAGIIVGVAVEYFSRQLNKPCNCNDYE